MRNVDEHEIDDVDKDGNSGEMGGEDPRRNEGHDEGVAMNVEGVERDERDAGTNLESDFEQAREMINVISPRFRSHF